MTRAECTTSAGQTAPPPVSEAVVCSVGGPDQDGFLQSDGVMAYASASEASTMRRRFARHLARDGSIAERPIPTSSAAVSRHPVQRLQASIGNRAVTRLLAREPEPAPTPPAAMPTARVEPGTDVPKRPSEPADQMKELHDTAEGAAGAMMGKCYRAFKQNVKAAGGYGDILDIYLDARFKGHQVGALQFSDAVDEHGAEALGLEEVEGAPESAEKGTILVLKGGAHGISKDYGDISVISEVTGSNNNVLKCYNDGTLKLSTKGLSDIVRGIYKPVARPEIKAE